MAPEFETTDDEQYESAQEEIIEDEGEDYDDGSSVTEQGPIGREYRGEDEEDVEGAGDGDVSGSTIEDVDMDGEDAVEGDLFSSYFQDAVQESDEDEEPALPKPTFVATEHTKGCTSPPGPSTPPPEKSQKSRSSSAQLTGPRPPNAQKDLSWNLRRLKKFYFRAKELIPRLPLAEHRYWIGVLNVGKNPDNFKCEKDFIWMKGNRKTTVETVSQSRISFKLSAKPLLM